MKNYSISLIKAASIALTILIACLLLFTIIKAQADDSLCSCTDKICSETEQNSNCTTCASDYKQCASQEPVQTCDCAKQCTEAEQNMECALCADNITSCTSSVSGQACACVIRCAETAVNSECPFCKTDFNLCVYEDPSNKCDCTKSCMEAEANTVCPVCKDGFGFCKYEERQETSTEPVPDPSLAPVCECTKPCTEADKSDGCSVCVKDFDLCAKKLDADIPAIYVVQYFANDSEISKEENTNKELRTMTDTDSPQFEQKCIPNTEYNYPTLKEVGLEEPRAHIFSGWSKAKGGAGTVHQPGESFKDLAASGEMPIRLYGVWEEQASYNVTLLQSPNVKDDGEHFGIGKAIAGRVWTGELLMQGYHLDPNSNPLEIKVSGAALAGSQVAKIDADADASNDTLNNIIPADRQFAYTEEGQIIIRSTEIKNNISIKAKATANKFKIHYNKNADTAVGEMPEDARTYNDNMAPLKKNAFVYQGYIFLGWARSESATEVGYNDEESVHNLTGVNNAVVELYAVWQYGQGLPLSLQNGSFEFPVLSSEFTLRWNGFPGIAWSTTASDTQIEIGRPKIPSVYNTFQAADGNQFAELNANSVGALYQNVATVPGSQLSWGLDHKCRNNSGIAETMQVWIGSKLEVETAIEQYKGKGNNDGNVSRVDKELLAKIKVKEISDVFIDEYKWTTYSGTYVVPQGQGITMFAFVSTLNFNPSVGNLLDNVYFSSKPPPAKSEVTVESTSGGGVIITYDKMPQSTLDYVTNPRYTAKLENGKGLKLYSLATDNYIYNGAFLDGIYTPKKRAQGLSWVVGVDMPKTIKILYSKIRTISFMQEGGVIDGKTAPFEIKLDGTASLTVKAPTKPGYEFTGWEVACSDLLPADIASPKAILASDIISYETGIEGRTSLKIARNGATILTIPGENGIIMFARYTMKETKIAVNLDGGKNIDGSTSNYNLKVTALSPEVGISVPTKQDFDFIGWQYMNGTNTDIAPVNTSIRYNASSESLTIGTKTITPAPRIIALTAKWATRNATSPVITTAPTGADMVYGDTSKAVAVEASTVAGHVLSYQWYQSATNSSSGGISILGATGKIYNIPSNTTVGNHYYYCKVTANRTATGKNASLDSNTAKVTVSKRSVALNWSADDFVYDGKEKTITAVVTDALFGDHVTVLTYNDNTGTKASTYTAIAMTLSNSNYSLGSNPADRHNWEIGKKVPIISARLNTMKFIDETATSNHAEITFEYNYDGDGDVTAKAIAGGELVNITIDKEAKKISVKVKNAILNTNGQVSVVISALEGKNYGAKESAPVLLNIQLGQLIGGADGYVGIYDGKPHGIIVRPMFAGYPYKIAYDTVTNGTYSYPSSPTYVNVVETQTVYYKIIVEPIKGLLDSALEISGDKTVTINPAPLTSTYESETITFGGTPAYKVNVTGFKNGETEAALNGFKAPTVATTATKPGVYTLTPSSGAISKNATANYVFKDYISGVLTILEGNMSSQISSAGYTGVYDGSEHVITVNVPSNTSIKYGMSADSCTADRISYKNTGEHTVYYKVSKDGFKDVIGSEKVMITKKLLTATYLGETVLFNSMPAYAITLGGFVSGEDGSIVTPPAVRNDNTFPGSYVLSPEGGIAENYYFNYKSGLLVINPIATTVAEIKVIAADATEMYDSLFHDVKVKLEGTNASVAAIRYGTTAENCSRENSPRYKEAGTYKIHYLISVQGYTDVRGIATLVINQRSVFATKIQVEDKVYDGTLTAKLNGIELKFQVDMNDDAGLVKGDDITASGTVSFTDANVADNKHVNISSITLSGSGRLNYIIGNALLDKETNAKITPKPITPEWKLGSNPGAVHDRVYDGQPSNVYAVVTSKGGLIPGENRKIRVTSGNAINVGSHTASAICITNDVGSVDSNYKLVGNLTQTYKNTPAQLVAKCVNETITYYVGIKDRGYTVEVTGFVNGETPESISASGIYRTPTVSKPAIVVPEEGKENVYDLKLNNDGMATNYEFTLPVTGILTVKQGNLNASIKNYVGDYDGQPHSLDITFGDLGQNRSAMPKPKVTYSYKGEGGATITESAIYTYESTSSSFRVESGTVPKCINAGSTEISYTIEVIGYTSLSGLSNILIKPKKISATLVASGTPTKRYDGNTNAASNAAIKLNDLVGAENLNIVGEINFDNKNVAINKAVTAKELKLTDGTLGKAGNYELVNIGASAILQGVEIIEKPITLTWSGNSVAELVYSGKEKNVKATIKDGDVIADDNCIAVITGGNGINVGAHTASAVLNNSNYKIADIAANASQKYSIERKELQASCVETITFGDTPLLKVEVSGFVNKETGETVAGYEKPTVATTPIPTGAGIHTLALTGGKADNYRFTLTSSALTIKEATIANQVIASDYSGIYDGLAHGITVNVPAGAVVTYYEDDKYTTSTAVMRADAGETTSYYKVTMANYEDVKGSKKITVKKKSVIAGVTNVASKVYDGKTTASGDITLNGVLDADLSQVSAGGIINFTDKHAGFAKPINVHKIELGGARENNYTLAKTELDDLPTNMEISQKPVQLLWSDVNNFTYDEKVKNVTATLGGIIGDDDCTVTVEGGVETASGSYTARAVSLSNPNYKLPDSKIKDFIINKGTFTVGVTPHIGQFNRMSNPAVTLNQSELRTGDIISYRIDSINNVSTSSITWLDTVPKIAKKGAKMGITVNIERQNFEPFSTFAVSSVWRDPMVTLEVPEFDQKDPTKVKVKGKVADEEAQYGIDYVAANLREKDSRDVEEVFYKRIDDNAPKTFEYEQILEDLKPNTTYELQLLSATIGDDADKDSEGHFSDALLTFRTLPEANTVIGEIKGKVISVGATPGSISVTLRKSGIVVASIKNLSDSDAFVFEKLADGEYNIVGDDDRYTVNQTVTVKNGRVAQGNIEIELSNRQTQVIQSGLENIPSISVEGLSELFDDKAIRNNQKVYSALGNGGAVKMVLKVASSKDSDDIETIREKYPMQGNFGLSVSMFLYNTIRLTSTVDLDEPDEHIRTKLDKPLKIAIEMPTHIQNKFSYEIYRSHQDRDDDLPGVIKTVEKLPQLTGHQKDSFRDEGFFVEGGYIYIYSNQFSTFLVDYKESPGSGGGSSGGSGGSKGENGDNGTDDKFGGDDSNQKKDDNDGDQDRGDKKPEGDPSSPTASKGNGNSGAGNDKLIKNNGAGNTRGEGIIASKEDPVTQTDNDDLAYNKETTNDELNSETAKTGEESTRDRSGNPFVILSALFAFAAITLALVALLKRRDRLSLATATFAVIALIVFICTSDLNGFAIANNYTMVVAALLVGAAVTTFYKKDKKNKSKKIEG